MAKNEEADLAPSERSAHNASRFVIIDGVQYSKERAKRLGLLEDKTSKRRGEGSPSANRARSAGSARKGAPVNNDDQE